MPEPDTEQIPDTNSFTVDVDWQRSRVRAQMQSGFGAAHFAMTDSHHSRVIAYSGFDDIRGASGLVSLRTRRLVRRLAYPRALFGDADVERLRDALAGPGPGTNTGTNTGTTTTTGTTAN